MNPATARSGQATFFHMTSLDNNPYKIVPGQDTVVAPLSSTTSTGGSASGTVPTFLQSDIHSAVVSIINDPQTIFFWYDNALTPSLLFPLTSTALMDVLLGMLVMVYTPHEALKFPIIPPGRISRDPRLLAEQRIVDTLISLSPLSVPGDLLAKMKLTSEVMENNVVRGNEAANQHLVDPYVQLVD
jgi:hypothetical protein